MNQTPQSLKEKTIQTSPLILKSTIWKKYGLIFGLTSIASIFTIAVPMITVLPASFLEIGLSTLFDEYLTTVQIGFITLFLLLSLLVASIITIRRHIKSVVHHHQKLSQGIVLLYTIVLFFIGHSLGYYILLAIDLAFSSDALIALSAIGSFPFSGVALIILGLYFDCYTNNLNRANLTAPEIK